MELSNLEKNQRNPDYERLSEHVNSHKERKAPNPDYERLKLENENNPYTRLGKAGRHNADPVYQNTSTKFIVCIDIGNKYSGYAFSPANNRDDVTKNENWGAKRGMTSYKTPSIVTFTGKKSKLIGMDAFDSFQNDEIQGFLWNFKMNVTSKSRKVMKRCQKAYCGMAEALVKHAMYAIKMKYNRPSLSMSEVLWKFSVPSFWSCALRRRIEKQLKGVLQISENIVLQREADLVSLYCISMYSCMSDVLLIHTGAMSTYFYGYNIKDIGVEEKFRGAVCQGGDIVNHRFTAVLQDILSVEFMRKCKQEYPTAYSQVLFDFETAKQGYNEYRGVSMSLPYSFAECYQTITNYSLRETLNSYTQDGHKVMWINKQGKLEISGKTMDKLYEPLRSGFYQSIRYLEVKYGGFDPGVVYLTGGLADCKVIQNVIQNIYSNVIIPEHANLCAMKGGLCYPDPYFKDAELSIKLRLKQSGVYLDQQRVLFHKGDLRCNKYNWRPPVAGYSSSVTEVITCDITAGSEEREVRSDADTGSSRKLKIDLYQIEQEKNLLECMKY